MRVIHIFTLRNFNYLLLILAAFASMFNLIFYSGIWSGDPEIHIIFAHNLLQGNLLQFNIGENSSGETSIIYMFLIAGLAHFLSPGLIPFAMKLIGILSLLTIIFILTKRVSKTDDKYLITVATLCIPSLSFQALLGMENMLFALLFSIICFSIIKPSHSDLIFHKRDLLLASVGVLLFFLRPEAIFLLVYGVIYNIWQRRITSSFIYLASIGLLFCLISILNIILDAPLHGAGNLRALFSKNDALHLSIGTYDIYLNPKPLYYFISSSPFILLFFSSLFFGRNVNRLDVKRFILFSFLLSIPWCLHVLNFLPNTHYSRYQLYFFFSSVMFLISIYNGFHLKQTLKLLIHIAVLILSLSIFVWENTSRGLWLSNALTSNRLQEITSSQSPYTKKQTSKSLCAAIGGCNLEDTPIPVALQEVQIRLRLDERFDVYSLDGIVDYHLEKFIDDENCVNHFDYLKYRKIKVLLEFQKYTPNHSDCGVTLRNVQHELDTNGIFVNSGITFHAFEWDGHTRAFLEYAD